MNPAEILAYVQVAQVLIAAGIGLGQSIEQIAVKVATLFHGKPMTEEELNAFIAAVRDKADSIKAQAEADAAQARLDEEGGSNPPTA